MCVRKGIDFRNANLSYYNPVSYKAQYIFRNFPRFFILQSPARIDNMKETDRVSGERKEG